MRVAFFTETFLPKIDGIVTRIARTLDQFAALGHEALIFAPHDPPAEYAGHRIIGVPALPFRPWYPELFLGLPRPQLGRELDRFDPHIVHVVNPVVLGLWGTAIAKQRNRPLLASYHTDLAQYAQHLRIPILLAPGLRFVRDVHNQAHVNLVTSNPMMDSARELGIKRVRLWPKAVDTDLFHPDRKTREMRDRLSGGHPDAPLAIYVGRLSYEKRIDWLHAPITRVPGLRLALVGSGPAEAELKERFADTATTFTGYMSGADLAAAYASADMFLFPSDTETLGFVAMESMASGVPAVGARAGGIPDVIDHGVNGLMFSPGDLDDLTAQVTTLVTDVALRRRLGSRAREDMEPHGWRSATEALFDHYRTAMRVHRRYDPPSRY
ncbi:MAG TPA: glycosyltransferase [Trueperaceae bacterium]|nr:glycosyltransferase [Trueperaceae bacterium]